ncbi:MAG: hypothetical protein HY556_03070 [Euryarchaeota archaeon]|nr:hypothetical protein [Euryarchaeota archaeon]
MPLSVLRRLFRKDPERPMAPPDDSARRVLEHERRRLQRALREIRRVIKAHHCSSCLKAEDPAGVALGRRENMIAEKLRLVEARLGAAE